MKKKKLTPRHRSRFHFRPLHFVITLVVLLGLSLYSAFTLGTGPLSFLASNNIINEVAPPKSNEFCGRFLKDDCVGVTGCKVRNDKCVSDGTTPTKEEPQKEEAVGYCETNGHPVEAGTWAVVSRTKCAKCLDCAQGGCNGRKVGFEFQPDSSKWKECGTLSETGQPVTMPGYAGSTPDSIKKYCGKDAESCKSCLVKVGGRYIQYGIGQQISDGLYCAPDGSHVDLADLQTSMDSHCPGQRWVQGRGCQDIPTKELTPEEKKLAQAQKDCDDRKAKGEQVGWSDNKCRGTAIAEDFVTSKDQCASDLAEPVPGNQTYKFRCVDKKAAITPCKPGPNPEDLNKSYITCSATSGAATYHYCANGVFQTTDRFNETKWECKQASTPTQPVTQPEAPVTYEWANKECDGSYADKDASGKWTSMPSCSQVCGGLGFHPIKGKYYCNEPKPATPAQPVANPSCSLSQSICQNKCTDTKTDKNNCGSCGIVCTGTGATCYNGDCILPAGGNSSWKEVKCSGNKLVTRTQEPGQIFPKRTEITCPGTCDSVKLECTSPAQPANPIPDTQPPSDANWNDAGSTVQLPATQPILKSPGQPCSALWLFSGSGKQCSSGTCKWVNQKSHATGNRKFGWYCADNYGQVTTDL